MDTRLSNEIKHGKFISRQGENIWNWSSPAGLVRSKRRADIFKQVIGNKGKKVLEIGCGTGIFTEYMAKTKNTITAIDIAPDLLAIAKKRLGKARNVKFAIENASGTKFKKNAFDFIFGSSILHHLNIDQALPEFYRILKPGGKIIFTEPNHLNPQIMLERSHPYFRKLFNNSPDETAFFRQRLAGQLKKQHFRKIAVTPFDFLHPAIPKQLINVTKPAVMWLERIPVIREFSGSLIVFAEK